MTLVKGDIVEHVVFEETELRVRRLLDRPSFPSSWAVGHLPSCSGR